MLLRARRGVEREDDVDVHLGVELEEVEPPLFLPRGIVDGN